MAVLFDEREGLVRMVEPVGAATILRVEAPAEAEAGATFNIPVLVDFKERGDYFTYLIDADTGEILDSDRTIVLIPGRAWLAPFRMPGVPAFSDVVMPDRDFRWRIEVWSEPPPGYPAPID